MLVIKIQPAHFKKMRRPDDLAQAGEDAPIELDEGERVRKKRKKDEDDEGEWKRPQAPVVTTGTN